MDPAELLIDLLAFFPRTPQEAWEAAIARELIPQAWAEDPRHGFECIFCAPRRTLPALADCGICRGERLVPYPQYAALFEAILKDPGAFSRVEALAFEVPGTVNQLYASYGPAKTLPPIESVTWAYNPFLGLDVPLEIREPDLRGATLYKRQWREGGNGGWILEHVHADGEIWRNCPFARDWLNEDELAPLAEIVRLGARFGFWGTKDLFDRDLPLTSRQKAGAILQWHGLDNTTA